MRVVFGRRPEANPGLFSGQAWMDAAEAWAAELDQRVEQWRVDGQFLVGGVWYRVEWSEGTAGQFGQWKVTRQS
jgi:hypothetical protein